MKNPRTAVVATAIPLILTSLRIPAAELPFNAPTTERAQESAPLLHQAARALRHSLDRPISHLWLFPTADAHTVFARYNLTSTATSGLARITTEHLAVLTVDGNRIVESRELTSSAANAVSQDFASLDWSATIGTGYAAHPDMINAAHGIPASPHWTATIGSGTAATVLTDVGDAAQPISSSTKPVTAAPHWTSRIGRGDAVDSSPPAVNASLVKAR